MPDLLQNLSDDLKSWANAARQHGWLNERSVQTLDSTSTVTPGSLFDTPNRPLVVGFFGGTGVGKSTLMNRFAGEAVARTSAERPTSREITLYVHESVSVAKLPPEFPLNQLKTETHRNDEYRAVLWIDMPDFDSVEQANRHLVEAWLPHIDVVAYVVSPERYRDDNGWRLLLEHGTRHAWLFVINHWDRGDDRQRDDFMGMLQSAGLSDPLLFCTDSSEGTQKNGDEFDQFKQTINSLADQQLIDQLESRGIVQRLKQIRDVSEGLRQRLGTNEKLDEAKSVWQSHWKNSVGELQDSIEWKIPDVAQHYAAKSSGLIGGLIARVRGTEQVETEPLRASTGIDDVLDAAFFDRIDESVDEFAQQANALQVPLATLKQPSEMVKQESRSKSTELMQQSIAQSLAAPGSKAHRAMHRTLGWLCWLLPLAAMCWIGFRVVNVFRLGADDPAVYLSSNFVVNGLLLLGLAWLVPTVLYLKLAPSRVKAAARGIRNGVTRIGEHVDDQLQVALSNLETDRQTRLGELDDILSTGLQFNEGELPESLKRMLVSS